VVRVANKRKDLIVSLSYGFFSLLYKCKGVTRCDERFSRGSIEMTHILFAGSCKIEVLGLGVNNHI